MNKLEALMNELTRQNSIADIVEAVIISCDNMADFAHSSNDKKMEEYYRKNAVAIFETLKKIENYDDLYDIS